MNGKEKPSKKSTEWRVKVGESTCLLVMGKYQRSFSKVIQDVPMEVSTRVGCPYLDNRVSLSVPKCTNSFECTFKKQVEDFDAVNYPDLFVDSSKAPVVVEQGFTGRHHVKLPGDAKSDVRSGNPLGRKSKRKPRDAYRKDTSKSAKEGRIARESVAS